MSRTGIRTRLLFLLRSYIKRGILTKYEIYKICTQQSLSVRFVSNLLRQFFCQSCSISDVENHNHYTETSEKYTKLSWVQTSAKEYVLLCNVKLTCNIEIKLVTKIIGIIVLTLTVWHPANNSKLAIFLHIANRGRRNNIPGFSVLVLVCFISFFIFMYYLYMPYRCSLCVIINE